jgi:hypothetical protein
MTIWSRSTAIGTVGGAGLSNLMTQLNTFLTSVTAETGFPWEIASYQSVSPRHLVLKRKNGTAGRIMFFGENSAGTTPAAAAIVPGGNVRGTNRLFVCYDPTATADAPPTSFLVGNPWSSANSLGHMMINTDNMAVPTGNCRAYWTNDDQLFFHFYAQNSSHLSVLHIGNILREASGLNPSVTYPALCMSIMQSETLSTGRPTQLLDAWFPGATGDWRATQFGCPDTTLTGTTTSPTFVSCSVYISEVWYKMNRLTAQRFTQQDYVDTAGRYHFIPILWCLTPDTGAVLPRVLKSKNLGAGPCRVRDFTILDNALNTRGYYIGHHSTQGSDVTGLSLLNDDM